MDLTEIWIDWRAVWSTLKSISTMMGAETSCSIVNMFVITLNVCYKSAPTHLPFFISSFRSSIVTKRKKARNIPLSVVFLPFMYACQNKDMVTHILSGFLFVCILVYTLGKGRHFLIVLCCKFFVPPQCLLSGWDHMHTHTRAHKWASAKQFVSYFSTNPASSFVHHHQQDF